MGVYNYCELKVSYCKPLYRLGTNISSTCEVKQLYRSVSYVNEW